MNVLVFFAGVMAFSNLFDEFYYKQEKKEEEGSSNANTPTIPYLCGVLRHDMRVCDFLKFGSQFWFDISVIIAIHDARGHLVPRAHPRGVVWYVVYVQLPRHESPFFYSWQEM